MEEFFIRRESLLKYQGNDELVVIPPGVKTIARWAFSTFNKGKDNRKHIIIPQSVVKIEDELFCYANQLTCVEVEEGNAVYASQDGMLLDKEKKRLLHCPRARTGKIVVPDGVTVIEDRAFMRCEGVTDIELPDSVRRIGPSAFTLCMGLARLAFSENVVEISKYACMGCDALATVSIGNAAAQISEQAFSLCSELTLIAPSGSTAERYAKENGLRFEAM